MPKSCEELRIGSFQYRPDSSELLERDGKTTTLRPQTARVLEVLLDRAGQVVTKQELIDQVWHDTHVTDDSLVQCISEIRKALRSEEARRLVTIPKKGYRLNIGQSATLSNASAESWNLGLGRMKPSHSAISILSVIVLLLAVVTLAAGIIPSLLDREREDVTRIANKQERRTIAALPIKATRPGQGMETLADGLTDDLTLALTKHPDLLVISRDSAFLYQSDSGRADNVAKNLDADLIVTGVLGMTGEIYQLSLRLTQAKTGELLWSDRIEAAQDDSRRLQQLAVASLRSALEVDQTRLAAVSGGGLYAQNESAYRAFTAGRRHFFAYLNRTENDKARSYFELALAHDSKFTQARAMLAWTYAFEAMNGWAVDRDASLQRALEEANKAKALDAHNPTIHFVRGLVFRERGEYIKAMVEAEKATLADPNHANGQVLLATLLYYAGRPRKSIDRLRAAMKINPHYPFNYSFHLGQAYFTLEDYGSAIEAFQAGLESNPSAERLHVWLAAAYARAGRIEDAKWEAEQVLTLNPEFSISRISEAFPYKDQNDRNRFLDGLRKAGLS